MRKVVMYCDRCGKEFEKWNDKRNELIGVAEFVYNDYEPYLDGNKDLCESCYNELKKWWNSKPVAEDTDTKPVKKHRDVKFKIGDKVRTLVETVDGCKLFPVGTIGTIMRIDNNGELPYKVYSRFHGHWYYPKDALELVEEEELDMADIELLIKIPEETYRTVCNEGILPTNIIAEIKRGTPLPKGHGKLIDADEIIHLTNEIEAEDREEELNHLFLKTVLTDAPTIIEEDKRG